MHLCRDKRKKGAQKASGGFVVMFISFISGITEFKPLCSLNAHKGVFRNAAAKLACSQLYLLK
jgi:hypothetical protein